MPGLRFAALILLAGAGVMLARAQQAPVAPCGNPIYNNELWINSRSFCVRERSQIQPDGGHRLRAAVDGAGYCKGQLPKFKDVTRCRFSATVRCHRKTAEFLITARFLNCREVLGRKNFTLRRQPLADALEPPGLSPSAAGAFVL